MTDTALAAYTVASIDPRLCRTRPAVSKIRNIPANAAIDIISSMTKARRYGFHEVVDTEEMFLRIFSELRANRIIP